MAAASIFRRSTKDSLAHLRLLFPPMPGLARRKYLPPSLVNWEICDPILDKLNLAAYKRTTIIDMNPNLGIFSAALHERLQPKQHILLEPEKAYADGMREFQKLYKNSWYVPLDGYNWNTYNQLFSDGPLPPPWPDNFPKPEIKTTAPSGGVNADLLFVGHMGRGPKSERLMAQSISCCALGSWIQRYGRVRVLLWVADSIKDKYLPRSIASRARPTATAEAVVDLIEVASSNVIRTGKGFQKLPVMSLDNVQVEEKKPAPSKPSKRKEKNLRVNKKYVEDEIKKLVAEELGLPDPLRIRGRPRKVSAEHQKQLEETTAKFRKIVEEIRDGKEPEPPTGLPAEKCVRMLDRYDEIRRAFGHRTRVEMAAENVQKKKDKQRQKFNIPRNPGRPRKLPQRGESATIGELEAIEGRIMASPGLWIQGMEHPPWYYRSSKKELRELAIKMAAMHPALRVDPNEVLQPEDIYSTTAEVYNDLPEEAAKSEGPSTISARVGEKDDKNVARLWEEYEEQWSRRHEVKSRQQGQEDQIYAVHNRLLKIYDRPYEPLYVDPAEDFFPATPMTLLEMIPKIPHPFFSPPSPRERESNWLTFEWLLRHLFILRASSVISALRSLSPGAENILADLPANQAIQPSQRVRCLTTEDLVNLAMAWKRWPFRDRGSEFQKHVRKDPRSSTMPID